MSELNQSPKCNEFHEDLAAILEGDATRLERHADHLVECDACRDLRHEAADIARGVADAGRDYVSPVDMEQRILAALDTRGASGAAPSATAASTSAASLGDRNDPAPLYGPGTSADDSRTSGERSARASDDRTREAERETAARRDEAKAPAGEKAKSGRGKLIVLFGGLAAAAALLLAIAGMQGWLGGGSAGTGDDGPQIASAGAGAFQAKVSRVERAANDGQTGVTIRPAGQTAFTPISAGADVAPGATVRTDESTRARLTMSDGSVIVLNHGTEVTLDPQLVRTMNLAGGEVVAEIAHLGPNAPHAFFVTPTGRVEVLGTKFVLSAGQEGSSVRVTRGAVQVTSTTTPGTATVSAGQEGLMPRSAAVRVAPVMNLAHQIAWSELGEQLPEDARDDAPIPGLGELRAKRPGERTERERNLTLAHHKVSVRIVGNVARTEIEETFRNDSGDTLEGIYRFPLPPDARIASLSLEVEGRWEEGAFVEKDRAQKIWRGVIRNATARHERQREEEFIWVPGPWRDPALLEWQRGGRFELRIFPIPARGERRMRLSYTQTIAPGGKGRRYVYPLPHSSDGSTRVGRFEADIRVAGADTAVPVDAINYDLNRTTEDRTTRLTFDRNGFVPAGDLIVDYALPNGESEIRWWTYQGAAASPPAADTREGDEAVIEAQRNLANDGRGYVVFAIRPELPAWTANQARDYVLVVDASQSMVGERYERASRLVESVVGEMDRRDRFVLMACDTTCRTMSADPQAPSAAVAAEVRGWLAQHRPAGASDLVAQLRAAAHALDGKRQDGRDLRVIYIGDGLASVGHRRASSIASEVQSLASPSARTSFTSVGIGGDSDATVLASIARAGGGHYVPYTPGERISTAAVAVLETTYGVSLTDARLELPSGVEDVAPARLPTIRAGEEIIVAGRITGEIRGEVVLRGKVAGRDYSDRYPVTLTPQTAAGNAFVPRLWAAQQIEQLDLEGRGEDRTKMIAMSKAFNVLSRHTSLLVLESEAMFRAFGVDRNQGGVTQWSGEEDVVVGESSGLQAHGSGTAMDAPGEIAGGDLDDSAIGGGRAGLGMIGSGSGGGGGEVAAGPSLGVRGAGETRARRSAAPSARMAEREEQAPARRPAPSMDRAAPAAEPAAPTAQQPAAARDLRAADTGSTTTAAGAPAAAATPVPPPMQNRRWGGGQWMRKVWYRVGAVSTSTSPTGSETAAVSRAEDALRQQPDSRDRHRDLVRALSRAGNLERAREIADKWMGRDRLDAEALTYFADVLGRQGQRDESVRYLSGVVDLEADSVTLHERLANAFERAGMAERACAHRITLAEIARNDAQRVGAALRCERALGRSESASRLLQGMSGDEARAAAERVAAETPDPARNRGELMIDASWSAPVDLDLSIVTPQGTRISWMGGRTGVVGESASATGRERLGLRSARAGSYVIEVSRVNASDRTPVSGQVAVTILGERRTINFNLSQARTTLGRVEVRRESRLEAAW